jgi:hypothetical protein
MSAVYKDSLIEITDQEIVFHHYYSLFGNDRRVPFSQIEAVQVRQPSLLAGSWRLWGTEDFRTWFPLDKHRPSRDRIFMASLRGKYWRIGFTVEDSQKVTGILRERGLLK